MYIYEANHRVGIQFTDHDVQSLIKTLKKKNGKNTQPTAKDFLNMLAAK